MVLTLCSTVLQICFQSPSLSAADNSDGETTERIAHIAFPGKDDGVRHLPLQTIYIRGENTTIQYETPDAEELLAIDSESLTMTGGLPRGFRLQTRPGSTPGFNRLRMNLSHPRDSPFTDTVVDFAIFPNNTDTILAETPVRFVIESAQRPSREKIARHPDLDRRKFEFAPWKRRTLPTFEKPIGNQVLWIDVTVPKDEKGPSDQELGAAELHVLYLPPGLAVDQTGLRSWIIYGHLSDEGWLEQFGEFDEYVISFRLRTSERDYEQACMTPILEAGE